MKVIKVNKFKISVLIIEFNKIQIIRCNLKLKLIVKNKLLKIYKIIFKNFNCKNKNKMIKKYQKKL